MTGASLGVALSLYAEYAPQSAVLLDAAVQLAVGAVALPLAGLSYGSGDGLNIIAWYLWGVAFALFSSALILRFYYLRRWRGFSLPLAAALRAASQTDGDGDAESGRDDRYRGAHTTHDHTTHTSHASHATHATTSSGIARDACGDAPPYTYIVPLRVNAPAANAIAIANANGYDGCGGHQHDGRDPLLQAAAHSDASGTRTHTADDSRNDSVNDSVINDRDNDSVARSVLHVGDVAFTLAAFVAFFFLAFLSNVYAVYC